MQVSCSCNVYCSRTLASIEDATPRAKASGTRTLTHRARAQTRPYMRCTKRWIYTPVFNRSVVPVDRRTVEERAIHAGSPQLSSAPPGGPPTQQQER